MTKRACHHSRLWHNQTNWCSFLVIIFKGRLFVAIQFAYDDVMRDKTHVN